MSQSNSDSIVKFEIPLELYEEKNYSTIILYVLHEYGPQRPSAFYKQNRLMNKNTFYAHIKKLREKNYVSVTKKEHILKNQISIPGLTELNRRLKDYKTLNFNTMVRLEQERMTNFIDLILKFFEQYEINDEHVKVEYLELANEITRDKLNVFTQSVFDRLLLFLILNHPRFFPKYSIPKEEYLEMINQNSEDLISITDLNYFLQEVVEKQIYGIKFWKIDLDTLNQILYFRSNSEFGIYFETAIKAYLKRMYYLKNLIKGDVSLSDKELANLIQKIIKRLIIPDLFPPALEESLKDLIKEFCRKEFPVITDNFDLILSLLLL